MCEDQEQRIPKKIIYQERIHKKSLGAYCYFEASGNQSKKFILMTAY